jgi:uncharacterized protein (DUF697 family)
MSLFRSFLKGEKMTNFVKKDEEQADIKTNEIANTGTNSQLRMKEASSLISICSAINACIAFTPIVFLDTITIIVVQIVMLTKITKKYDEHLGATVFFIIASAMMPLLVLLSLFELLPVLGWIISIPIGAACTYILGHGVLNCLEAKKDLSFTNCLEGIKNVFNKNK